MLLLLSHFSRVRLCATPQTADHQAPLSLGFSRQEHWSGLPFPSPMHESEKCTALELFYSLPILLNKQYSATCYFRYKNLYLSFPSVSPSVMSDSFVTSWTVTCQAPLSMGFSRQEYLSGLPFPSPGDLPDPEVKPRSPALQADSLPSEPPGRPLVSKVSFNYCNFKYLGVKA